MVKQKNEIMLLETLVTNFELTYDGMYCISWQDEKNLPVFLSLDMLLKMFETEGLSLEFVKSKAQVPAPIHFDKVVLKLKGQIIDGKMSYILSDYADTYFDDYPTFLFEVNL
jgi:hypothetical protein